MKKWIVAMSIFFMSVSAVSAEGKIVLKWGDVVSEAHPAVQAAKMIAEEVNRRTEGRVEIQVYPSGQLGGSREMIEAVVTQVQEIVTEGIANLGQWVPAISIVEAPYIWRDKEHLLKTMEGPIGQKFNEELIAKRGIRMLAVTYYGTRQLTTTNKEIRSISDMAGFKLRVPENEVFLAMAKAWDARPTPMNFNELYLALKQNVVDGQENPLPTIDSGKFYEVQKYLVLTGHVITPRAVLINEKVWQGVAPEDRAVILEAVKRGVEWNDERIAEQERALLSKFKEKGVSVIEVNVEPFREAVLEKVVPQFEEKWGKGTWEAIQAVK